MVHIFGILSIDTRVIYILFTIFRFKGKAFAVHVEKSKVSRQIRSNYYKTFSLIIFYKL